MKSSSLATAFSILAAASLPFAAPGQSPGSKTPDPCAREVTADVPQVSITNGQVRALVDLPDPITGWYRSTRFDWSGVVPCLSYDGHTYFSPWRPTHDPLGHDSLSGPVEEFNSLESRSPLGFDEAKSGELFVKPGVGVLRRLDDAPYKFSTAYPIVDTGKWTSSAKENEVSMTQTLTSPVGYAYVYTKTLALEAGKPVLLIRHSLKNTGTRTIDTDVYDHDFYRLDNVSTGPDMVIHFPFPPIASKPFSNGGEIQGNDIVYHNELGDRQPVSATLTGYSSKVSDYDFVVKNKATGVGVEQTSDSPIAGINFWSVTTTIAPEAYIHLHIAPGATREWTIRYRFFDR